MIHARVSGREVPLPTLTTRVCQVGGELRITSELWRARDRPLVCAAHRGLPASPRCEVCLAEIPEADVSVVWNSGVPVLCAGCDGLPQREGLHQLAFLEQLGRRRLLEIAYPRRAAALGVTP